MVIYFLKKRGTAAHQSLSLEINPVSFPFVFKPRFFFSLMEYAVYVILIELLLFRLFVSRNWSSVSVSSE